MLKVYKARPVSDPGVLNGCWVKILGEVFVGGLDINACVSESACGGLLFGRVEVVHIVWIFDVFWVLVFSSHNDASEVLDARSENLGGSWNVGFDVFLVDVSGVYDIYLGEYL